MACCPGGKGMGAACVAIVTSPGAQAVVVTVRRIRSAACSFGACFMLLIFVRCAGRGDSAICTAPPPMIAPPQAQAHNLAKAIRTDIFDNLFVLRVHQVLPFPHPISSSEERPVGK